MPLKIITIGYKTDHDGTVISGSPNHDIRGRAFHASRSAKMLENNPKHRPDKVENMVMQNEK